MTLLVLLACTGADPDSGPPEAATPGALADANNYTFTGSLDAPTLVTASGTDVTVCWDEVAEDVRCQPLDPLADIDNVGLIRFSNLEEPEVEAALATDTLQQADVSGYVERRTDGASMCAQLSEFSFLGTPIDVPAEYTAGAGTFLLLLAEGTTPGVGARMLAFLEPTLGDTTTEVSVPSGCGVVDVAADLSSLTPVPLADAPWSVDWSALTRDGQGNPVAAGDIDSLMLGFYAGATPEDLAARLFDLEADADALYTLPLTGATTADLADATGSSGPFPGLSGDGTWLLALRCGSCYNPAPIFLTVLEPEAG